MAHVATSSAKESLSWLLDNGASYHVTADLNNLTLHAPYDGPDDIVIEDILLVRTQLIYLLLPINLPYTIFYVFLT